MEEKFYSVVVDGEGIKSETPTTKEKAHNLARKLASIKGKKVYVVEWDSFFCPEDIDVAVDLACEDLGIDPPQSLHDVTEKHKKALESLYKLILIAEAWNKADGFVPDYANKRQEKWFPFFTYIGADAGFASASTNYAASSAAAYSGSRLCFKTRERAEQFGTQFIDLWNDFLLVR
ncbi:MAG: hypothetical protein LBQ39_07825 [Tannerellaceae bacterium]|jgi:hypothetical protein|nr:hypothetical protein [Tannerellaceae bacterium]